MYHRHRGSAPNKKAPTGQVRALRTTEQTTAEPVYHDIGPMSYYRRQSAYPLHYIDRAPGGGWVATRHEWPRRRIYERVTTRAEGLDLIDIWRIKGGRR